MRSVGLLLVLVGVIGIVLAVLAILGVPFVMPSGGTGDVHAPGAGPIIAGLMLIVVGMVLVGYRAER